MSFNGSIIKSKVKESGLNVLRLSEKLGVSRQTVNSWIGGAIPRGQHLVKLCYILNMKPNDFFAEPTEGLISVPLHRTIRGKPVSNQMKEASKELAEQYLNLFRQAPTVSVLPVVRIHKRTPENALIIASELRKLSDIDSSNPMNYKGAFQLLDQLGVFVVFRVFNEHLRKHSYAFYSRIAGNRVVFVNIDTNVLDLIFQLLHETVHAVRDEEPGAINLKEEENFCNMVAELTQFPDFYVRTVAKYISDHSDPAIIIKRMKEVSRDNNHSLFGIYYRLRHLNMIPPDLKVGGAATNLSKGFPTLRQILFAKDTPRDYVEVLNGLSPRFVSLVADQIPHCTVRKFGEWLGLETSMDSKEVIYEIARRKSQT